MTKKSSLQLFEQKAVRSVWDDEAEQWYFAVVNVVEVLTDSVNPTGYLKKLKRRDPELAKGWGQIVPTPSVQTTGGKQRMNCAMAEGVFRVIQSISSPKAEPFKAWMTQVAMWPRPHVPSWKANLADRSSRRKMQKIFFGE